VLRKDNSLWLGLGILLMTFLMGVIAAWDVKRTYYDKKEEGRFKDFLDSARHGKSLEIKPDNKILGRGELHEREFKMNLKIIPIAFIAFLIWRGCSAYIEKK